MCSATLAKSATAGVAVRARSLAKSTRNRPKRGSYPSAHSKLSISNQWL